MKGFLVREKIQTLHAPSSAYTATPRSYIPLRQFSAPKLDLSTRLFTFCSSQRFFPSFFLPPPEMKQTIVPGPPATSDGSAETFTPSPLSDPSPFSFPTRSLFVADLPSLFDQLPFISCLATVPTTKIIIITVEIK